MANQEHVKIIRQGVEVWNQWIKEHFGIIPDLSTPYMVSPGIGIVSEPDTDAAKAGLSEMNLSGVNFGGANLSGTNLTRANLSGANLVGAKLSYSDLCEAELIKAELAGVDFTSANLRGTDFSEAVVGGTIFADNDLRKVKGLETIHHFGPSTIGVDTIIRSQGNIPEIFLRNAGVPDSIIEAIPSLVGSLRPIDYYSCFISYSSKDEDFAKQLQADLKSCGVRCWFAPKDIKIGDKFRSRIDEAIRVCDKLLLILSEHSVRSPWVEKEVETAFEKERRHKRLVLFPIRLDDAIMRTRQAWAADIRRMRHIGDFTHWKNHDDYKKALDYLLCDLQADLPSRL